MAMLIFNSAFAETVVLKSGEKIEGTVVEKNTEYIRINFKGADIFYRTFEIKTIDAKPVNVTNKPVHDRSLDFLLASQGLKRGDAPPNFVTPEEYLNRGVIYYNKDNLEQAMSNLNKAIDADPKMAAAYLYRGLTYMKEEETDNAISDYNKAIELNPKMEEAYYVRGVARAAKKDIELALEDYNKAISINSNYVQAYLNRSIISLMKRDPEKAIADTCKVMDINSGLPAAYYIRGVAYANENNMQQAISDYDKAIKLDPLYVQAYLDRAFAYANKEKAKMSQEDKNSPVAYINIGIGKLNIADYDQAISDCSKAIGLAPKNTNAYLSRARIYIMGNDYDKAWADVRKVEELGGTVSQELLDSLKKSSGREK
jgi:tetratricopeptide (TPR) repeat protein